MTFSQAKFLHIKFSLIFYIPTFSKVKAENWYHHLIMLLLQVRFLKSDLQASGRKSALHLISQSFLSKTKTVSLLCKCHYWAHTGNCSWSDINVSVPRWKHLLGNPGTATETKGPGCGFALKTVPGEITGDSEENAGPHLSLSPTRMRTQQTVTATYSQLGPLHGASPAA